MIQHAGLWFFPTVTQHQWINSHQRRNMIKLSFPFTEEKIRALKVGDEVLISGVVFTGREIRN